ncbi:uncharacterized protein UBRO_12152 [Ustilago bromivora]|uniref:VHS domain-containing protein n=1 Tax=Ustilago bromivora TaxID=307758 RepID=A0A1K0FWJ1_9BASI|nr:uncharacterized protein UBRO_12152 [Ustilago bromivora]SYW75310.1 uncharacterized protein UBRO2_00545 [Ustilago bromivora]
MKKFFKTKEAGVITPLPPTGPAASTSSFGTPRPFEEYQARVASQNHLHRPLSYQSASASSRSGRGSSDENGYAYPSSQQPHRRSQQYSASDPAQQHSSPVNNRLAPRAAPESAYQSYSDPVAAQPQPYRPQYDRSDPSEFDRRASQPPPSKNSSRQPYQHQQQQPAPGMTATPPPRSLRPADAAPRHRPNNSMSVGPASAAGYHNQNGLHLPPNHASMDSAWVQRHRSDDYNGDDDDDDDDDDADGRTPTAGGGAQHSAAYPVYSGAEGRDEDVGEVLISQGRYEETVLKDPPGKDKKGKKLFGFATGGGNKDKKAKDERDRAAISSSPVPRGSRDRVHDDAAGLMSPPLDHHAHDRDRNRDKGGWIDRWNKRAHQHQEARLADKEAEEIVASKVGWLASSANTEQDWMHILPLINIIVQSDAASKEATRALRKEFKYGSVDTQRRAVRIWALLTLNGSDRFRQQIASKKFLDSVEDTIASNKTPLSVKETMLRVLGVLAFEFKDDVDLANVTKCWNKVKPNDRRKDGEPLEDNLFEFRLPQPRHAEMQQQQQPQGQQHQDRMRGSAPSSTEALRNAYLGDHGNEYTSQRRSSATTLPLPPPPPPTQQQQPWSHPHPHQDPTTNHWPHTAPVMEHRASNDNNGPDIVSNLEVAAASMDNRSASYQSFDTSNSSYQVPHEIVAHDEDVRRLQEEFHIARSNASVLLDTLLHEGLHAETVELVDEFYNKVVMSQDVIASQIPWASAQADRSKERANVGDRETREEKLLADLLDAHDRTSEVMRAVDEARRRIKEEEEELRVTERSKVEVRLDRSALVQNSSGDLYEMGGRGRAGLLDVDDEGKQEGGSRSASPSKPYTGSNPSSGFSIPPSSTMDGAAAAAAARVSRPLPVPRSDHSSSADSTSIQSAQSPIHGPGLVPPALPPHPTVTKTASSTASNSLSGSTHSRSCSQFALSPSNRHPPGSLSTSPGRSLPLTPNLNISTNTTNNVARMQGNEEEDDLQTPVVPSEKALGKRRAVSVRYPTPPPRPPANGDQGPPALAAHPNSRNSGGVNGAFGGIGGLRIGH